MYLFAKKSKQVVSLMALSCVLSAFAMADDAKVQAAFDAAKALYAQRSSNLSSIERAIYQLGKIENKADDSDLNYDILILKSRALYWKGQHVDSKEERIATHAEAQKKADEAREINDGYAEAYYYAGINLARWAEANGVTESLSRKGELLAYMEQTVRHNTRDEKAGETLDGYGPSRVLGRLYHKLPTVFGGNHDESVRYLSKAVKEAKSLALNVVYLAETLLAGSASERAEAKNLLTELLSQDPKTYNTDRTPETVEEFALACKLAPSHPACR